MTPSGRGLTEVDLWDKHTQRVTAILMAALRLLRVRVGAARLNENDLNRELLFCLLEANRQAFGTQLGGLDHPPVPEARNFPAADDLTRTTREAKVPDFQWGYVDHLSADARSSARMFVIECKRLGPPERSDWPFNKNYIGNGVQRFRDAKFGYAYGERTAAMVGYVYDSSLATVHREVNEEARRVHCDDIPRPTVGWRDRNVTELVHLVQRNIPVTPLQLRHYWIDLRVRRTSGQRRPPRRPGRRRFSEGQEINVERS